MPVLGSVPKPVEKNLEQNETNIVNLVTDFDKKSPVDIAGINMRPETEKNGTIKFSFPSTI